MSVAKLTADSVVARRLTVVDDDGNERVRVRGTSGFVTVDLSDSDGRPRLTLQLDNSGHPSITMWTKENALALSLALTTDGNGIMVGDANGCPVVRIDARMRDNEACDPTIEIANSQGDILWSSQD